MIKIRVFGGPFFFKKRCMFVKLLRTENKTVLGRESCQVLAVGYFKNDRVKVVKILFVSGNANLNTKKY